MENVNKIYDYFNENIAFNILKRNTEYMKAREELERKAKELKDTLNKAIELSKEYEDCLSDVSCIAYREYYKQGYKYNR